MIGRWILFLKGLKRAPEDSSILRVAVAFNVSVALMATGSQLEWPAFLWPCWLLTLFGMGLSHRLRHRNNWEVKAALSILMVLALLNFFRGFSRSYYDPREPLAELLMWLQALHSCDLPTRKDLSYSLLSALILMSVAAVLSIDLSFALYLLLYYVTAVWALSHNVRSLVAERTGWKLLSSGRVEWSRALGLASMALFSGTAVLLLMPRLEGFQIRAMPMSLDSKFQQRSMGEGEIRNPFYPANLSPEMLLKNNLFNPESYAGFNGVVDLQSRGKLSSQRVFQVKANFPAYFRAMTFDHYDGRFWTQSVTSLRKRTVANPPFTFLPPSYNALDIVQIFYIDRPLPNLVFFAPEAYQVFFPSQILYQDVAGCLRSPFTLEPGMVYSVVSRQSRMERERLVRLPRRDPLIRQSPQYRQLPESIPPRVRKLARDIVGDKTSFFEQASAISQYLQQHYRYNLEVPPYPLGVDAVDHFLFEAREGYCEQFASAQVVLCRVLGIPARYTTGYLPGRLNPFSGFREVRGDDAHAWSEVFLPGYGWLTVDSTPGGESMPELNLDGPLEERWLGLAILRYLTSELDVHWVWLFPGLAIAGGGLLLRALGRRSPGADPVTTALAEAMSLYGVNKPGTTPRAWAQGLGFPSAQQLVGLHERARYAGRVSPEDALSARQFLERLKEEARSR